MSATEQTRPNVVLPLRRFGLSWSFISQSILGDLAGDERTLGGAGIATVRLTGAAAGSAMAAAVANLAGFADGFSDQAARTAGVWVFAAALPVAGLACITAWRLGSLRLNATTTE